MAFVCALAAAAVACAFEARADDVAAYLEEHGLIDLLAAHLEERLESVTGDEREPLVRRLGDIYARLLERETDEARRRALEQRSRLLLERAPARSAHELRLALLRASCRTAEKSAENHRLRLANDQEIESARRTFADVIPALQALRQQIQEDIAALDRRLNRAAGADATSLNDQIEQARALHAQCTFLTAWSLYYDDWLNEGPQQARAAEPLFSELLGVESGAANPDEISVDLRSNEAAARSILGMGLCTSLTASSATAIAWVNLLTHPQTFEALRAQATAWVLAIHLEHREYREVQDVFDHAAKDQPALPVAWLRLVAAHTLEDAQRDRFGAELLRRSVTELASRGELQQVLDLAQRFGTEALGDSGFALRYVQGVIAYQQARQDHQSDEPTFDERHRATYQAAAEALAAALKETDASQYPAAMGGARRLIAWCAYFQANFLEAQREFEAASAALAGPESADALWMAIVSLEKIAESARDASVRQQLNRLTDRFLAQFPAHEQAAKLVVRRSVDERAPSPEAVAELLAVPAESDMHSVAQSRAADMLYQLFRKASPNDRTTYAGQFLSVAVPLLNESATSSALQIPNGAHEQADENSPPTSAPQTHPASIASAGSTAAARVLVRCRQVLEVALTEGVERLVAARAAFEVVERLRLLDASVVEPHRDELEARRVQERLYAGEALAAAELADALWQRAPDSIWSRLAVRSMFRQAHRAWKNPDAAEAEEVAALERIVRYGGRVLHEYKDDEHALERPGAVGYYTAVAEATFALWERTEDAQRAAAALFLYDKLLNSRPRSAAFLRSAAKLSQAAGQDEKALEYWRRLVAGLPVASDGWFEAKFHQIALLMQVDPPRARDVMAQHKALHPGFGPDPWGAKLKGLDEQIAAQSPASAPADQKDS